MYIVETLVTDSHSQLKEDLDSRLNRGVGSAYPPELVSHAMAMTPLGAIIHVLVWKQS